MYHSLNERMIEEFKTTENNKSGLLGVPMSSLFSISQQMYFGLNQEYNARAYIMENATQVEVVQCNRKMLAMRQNISAAHEDAWCTKAKQRSAGDPSAERMLAEKDLEVVMARMTSSSGPAAFVANVPAVVTQVAAAPSRPGAVPSAAQAASSPVEEAFPLVRPSAPVADSIPAPSPSPAPAPAPAAASAVMFSATVSSPTHRQVRRDSRRPCCPHLSLTPLPLQVVFDYAALEPSELSLVKDDVSGLPRFCRSARHCAPQVISVLEVDDSGWWKGVTSGGVEGWFPSNYIQRI
jgi:hypothetical protein